MTKQEIILKGLILNGPSNAKQLASAIKRKLDYDITPASASGTLRTLVALGKVSRSNCGNGSTVYWVNKEEI